MPPELVSAWETVEAGKAELLRRARALPPDVFAAPRKPGQWTYAQTLHHMAIAEGEVTGQIAAMEAGQTVAKPAPAFVLPLVAFVLKNGLPVPAPPNMLPPDVSPTLDEIERLWSEKRAFFKARLDGLGAGDLAVPIALHPIAGPLEARQVLSLADAHHIYHLRQFPK